MTFFCGQDRKDRRVVGIGDVPCGIWNINLELHRLALSSRLIKLLAKLLFKLLTEYWLSYLLNHCLGYWSIGAAKVFV